MIAAPPPQGLTFAVHPSKSGIGWVAFEGPFAPYDWGLVIARREKNATCLRKVEKLLARFLPHTLVVEVFDRHTSARSDRISNLYRAIVALASDRGVEVVIYSRGDVQACFASVGARTRQEIAEAVVRHIDAFRPRLPRKRKPWESEDRRLAMFSAAALILTHYQRGGSGLIDELEAPP